MTPADPTTMTVRELMQEFTRLLVGSSPTGAVVAELERRCSPPADVREARVPADDAELRRDYDDKAPCPKCGAVLDRQYIGGYDGEICHSIWCGKCSYKADGYTGGTDPRVVALLDQLGRTGGASP